MRVKLRECRAAAGVSQAEIARIAGVDLKTAGSWDRGITVPKADAVFAICDALGTDPNTLLGWYDDHPEDLPDVATDDAERALLDNYRACTPERREALSGMARDQCALSNAEGRPTASSDREAL